MILINTKTNEHIKAIKTKQPKTLILSEGKPEEPWKSTEVFFIEKIDDITVSEIGEKVIAVYTGEKDKGHYYFIFDKEWYKIVMPAELENQCFKIKLKKEKAEEQEENTEIGDSPTSTEKKVENKDVINKWDVHKKDFIVSLKAVSPYLFVGTTLRVSSFEENYLLCYQTLNDGTKITQKFKENEFRKAVDNEILSYFVVNSGGWVARRGDELKADYITRIVKVEYPYLWHEQGDDVLYSFGEATKQEIEEHLTQEAIALGFVINAEVSNSTGNEGQITGYSLSQRRTLLVGMSGNWKGVRWHTVEELKLIKKNPFSLFKEKFNGEDVAFNFMKSFADIMKSVPQTKENTLEWIHFITTMNTYIATKKEEIYQEHIKLEGMNS